MATVTITASARRFLPCCVSASTPPPHSLCRLDPRSGVPGDIVEDIALVDLHGIGDLGADRLQRGRVQGLNDGFRSPNVSRSQRLYDKPMLVVISRIALTPKMVEAVAGQL